MQILFLLPVIYASIVQSSQTGGTARKWECSTLLEGCETYCLDKDFDWDFQSYTKCHPEFNRDLELSIYRE